MPQLAYIAVHGGAGYHGTESQEEIKRALKRACREALQPFLVPESTIQLPNFQSQFKSREGMTMSQFTSPDSASLDAHINPPPPDADSWDRTSFSGTNFSNCEDKDPEAHRSNSASALLEAQGVINDRRRRSDLPALDMVVRGIITLEDDGSLNAGYGSNLTIDGTVECDAALVSGQKTLFGSVGAVEGIKNPIALARSVLEYSRAVDPLGRVPPLTLVSCGATKFAKSLNVHDTNVICVPPESLASPKARRQWEKWTQRLAEAGSQGASSGGDPNIPGSEMDSSGTEEYSQELKESGLMQDTVGAVGWHEKDGFAAGVSSGGLLLKLPGRLGEAAVFGAGCWAEQNPSGSDGVACSVSGTGEYIVRANLARKLCEALQNVADRPGTTAKKVESPSNPDKDTEMENESDSDDFSFTQEEDPHSIIEEVMSKDFWEICRQNNEQDPSVGVLVLKAASSDNVGREPSVRLWCAFTTRSMAIAYASSTNPKPKVMILRNGNPLTGSCGGQRLYITSISL